MLLCKVHLLIGRIEVQMEDTEYADYAHIIVRQNESLYTLSLHPDCFCCFPG